MKLHDFMHELACARDLEEVKFIKDGKEVKVWGFSIESIWKNTGNSDDFDARFLFTNLGDNEGVESFSKVILDLDIIHCKSELYCRLRAVIGSCMQDIGLCNLYKDIDIMVEYCDDDNSNIDILDIKSVTDEDMYIAINF